MLEITKEKNPICYVANLHCTRVNVQIRRHSQYDTVLSVLVCYGTRCAGMLRITCKMSFQYDGIASML
ncbi:MAG: hypothetical protein O7C59_05225 [Rickettsia endosymbiont of Ixodes persulcatus]|nr:hypothetical protein [Rickettsia endosymbiont of Ixodes persulcatus]